MGKNKANTAALDANMEKAKQEGKLLYRIKKPDAGTVPYFIYIFYYCAGAGIHRIKFYVF